MMLELSLALSCYPHKHLWKGHWSYINSWWGHRSTWSVCFWEIQHSQTSIDKTFLFRINSVSHTTGIESSTYTHQEKWMHNREKKIWRNTTFGLGASSAPPWITLYNSPLGRDTTSDSAALAYERVHHWVSTTSKRGSTPTVRAVQITQRSWLMMLLFSMHLGVQQKNLLQSGSPLQQRSTPRHSWRPKPKAPQTIRSNERTWLKELPRMNRA